MQVRRMRLAALALAALVLTASASAAEPRRAELVVGYGYLHDSADGEGLSFPFGWTAGLNYNLTPALGIVGEMGASYRSESESNLFGSASVDATVYSFMGGLKFTGRGSQRVFPYLQALAGMARLSYDVQVDAFGLSGSESDSATEFAIQPGGGVDILLTESIALRLGADYRRILAEGGSNEFRFVTGISFGFGEPLSAR